jgi:hypothetical protein
VNFVTSANALQADGQNGNGWNQGLVFYDTKRSWLQPPAYVSQMIVQNYMPRVVSTTCTNPDMTVTAKTDGTTLTLEVVNLSPSSQTPTFDLIGYKPGSAMLEYTQISGNRGDQNDAGNVNFVTPKSGSASFMLNGNAFSFMFPPNSFTILKLN